MIQCQVNIVSFIDLTGTTKTSPMKENAGIPHSTGSASSLRDYNSKNLISSTSGVKHINEVC